ncbi:SurA N-terminal domain-containing protein [Halobacillus shinanisalinarum]|uniref:peptidylprolyl isomerase n=1 Tax=Halobacillus shinanisalinarum TaxID=2932258 RepID=A0ABY4GYC3_9BACI|nr:SurA N-terminal domain-containing protein [Halobacillus shinanisalinarum]UOQ91777.1 SurA N-terminal domain-containing protein [Halobacillus shinanisalinarum]
MTLIKKWLLLLSLVVTASLIAACGNADESAEGNNEKQEAQKEESAKDKKGEEGAGQTKMPEPDLEGVPEVVAKVNGEEIPKEKFKTSYEGQFQRMAMQSQMSGQKVDQDKLKKQVAEGLVSQELLIQEADNRGLKASQKAIDETLNGLVKQNGLKSKEEFMSALKKQGMNEEEVMSQLKTQVKVDQLIAAEAGDVEPTDKELKAAYDQIKKQQEQMGGGAEIPSFDEMKPKLETQVKSQKEAKAAQTLVEKLRKDADVTVNL